MTSDNIADEIISPDNILDEGISPDHIADEITSPDRIAERIISSRKGIGTELALKIAEEPSGLLFDCAEKVTKHCALRVFDSCSIINAKSGAVLRTVRGAPSPPTINATRKNIRCCRRKKLCEAAKYSRDKGIGRFSIVTSGKKLSSAEVASLCDSVRYIKDNVDISICMSAGLLSGQELHSLFQAGVSRYHCNLETAPSYFGKLCTTHTQEQKISTLKSALDAGMEVCSGGIIGMGETMRQRIELACTLAAMGMSSVPINILSPIKGTLLENQPLISEEDILRTIAVFRLIMPCATLRFAGGRARLSEEALLQAYRIGINAAIMGDMLTTVGSDIETDFRRVKSFFEL